jgi:hypothetical protein
MNGLSVPDWVMLGFTLVFILCAISFFAALLRSIKTDRFQLVSLSRKPGGPDFQAIGEEDSAPWLSWLRQQTQKEQLSPPSRTEALEEFNRVYFSNSQFVRLSRLRDSTPFVGLLLTAFSAYWFYKSDLASLTLESPGAMIVKVMPILVGVAIGAGLNLGMSFLLYRIEGIILSFRSEALTWFDGACLTARERLAENVQRQVITQITTTSTQWGESIVKMISATMAKVEASLIQSSEIQKAAIEAAQAAQLAAITAAQASTTLEKSVSTLCGKLDTHVQNMVSNLKTNAAILTDFSTEYFTDLGNITKYTLEIGRQWMDMGPTIAAISTHTKNLAESSSKFVGIISASAFTFETSSKSFLEMNSSFVNTMKILTERTDQMSIAVLEHNKTLSHLDKSIDGTLIPAHSKLSRTIDAIERSSQGFQENTGKIAVSLGQASEGLARFDTVSQSFETTISKQFLPAMQSFEGISVTLENLQTASGEIKQTFMDTGRTVSDSLAQYKQILATTDTITIDTKNLTAAAIEAWKSMSETSVSFATTTTEVQKATTGMVTVSQQLGKISDGYTKVASVTESLPQLLTSIEGITERIERLDTAISVSSTIQGKLHEQLNQLSQALDDVKKRKGFFGRFFGT